MQSIKKKISILISILILVGTMFFILEKTRYLFVVDSDILWHIKTGKWIIEHREVPKTDVFSWHKGLNWMPHEWLYDIFLSIMYDCLGLQSVMIIALLLLTLRIGFVTVYNVFIKKENFYAYSLFLSSLLIFEGYTWAVGRPLEFTVIFILLNLLTFIKRRKKITYYFSFCLSCLAISNLHGGTIQTIFSQMIIFLGIDIIYYLRSNDKVYRKEELDEIKTKLKVTFAGFIVSLLNPHGINVYSYCFKMLFSGAKEATNTIAEWQPITFISTMACFVFVAIFISFSLNKKIKELDKETITKMAIISFWGIAMLRYNRCTPIFLFVVLLWGYDFIKDSILTIVNSFNLEKIFKLLKIISYLIVPVFILLTMVMGIKWTSYYFGHSEKELLAEGFPYESIEYLKKNNITTKIYNDDWGSWMLFNDIPTFVDGRCDPFVKEFSPGNSQFIEAANMEKLEDYINLFEKYDIEYALLKKDEDLSILLESTGKWKTIITERRAMLLKRVDI